MVRRSLRRPLAEMQRRVRERTDHPGGVHGASKEGIVAGSYTRIERPTHEEGFELVTHLETPAHVEWLTNVYKRVRAAAHAANAAPVAGRPSLSPASWPLAFELKGAPGVAAAPLPLPAVALGTMLLKGSALSHMLRRGGFAAVDTAPTYENETAVGAALDRAAHLTVKVPRKAQSGTAVREALRSSLRHLGRSSCELLLLHWPDQAIEKGTLHEVWTAMEDAVREGEAAALGVCNFTVAALHHLLAMRPSVPPSVNQVERHPLSPQWELLEYCTANRITLQARPQTSGHHVRLHGGCSVVAVVPAPL